MCPPPIVVWDPPPWLERDPSPTQGIIPSPPTCVKGHPIGITMRSPDCPKIWDGKPGAVLIELGSVPPCFVRWVALVAKASQIIVSLQIPFVPFVGLIV